MSATAALKKISTEKKPASAMAHPTGYMHKPSMMINLAKFDPFECPFREFRDNELGYEYWGLGTAAFRSAQIFLKGPTKITTTPSQLAGGGWIDDQTQPLPASIRHYLDGWVRAEELASSRWECEIVVYEDTGPGSKMSVVDFQLSHSQVLLRSGFCRRVLSHCFMLESIDYIPVEHQWDNFVFSLGPEGWRAKYHIYAPYMKPGGGIAHKPGISKTGCYLVRLYHLGAWRCVWVSDLVPVDASGAPLLPFSPLSSPNPVKGKGLPTTVVSNVVHLWPMLICKAMLKLAAPDMTVEDNIDENVQVEDERMPEFNIFHAFTGCLSLTYHVKDEVGLWRLLCSEVPIFSWDDDDDAQSSTIKSKATKKQKGDKEKETQRRTTIVTIFITDTKDLPPYTMPGIAPAHAQNLLVKMVRDLPLKKPLPEPEVPMWKTYRWVDWAKAHGLYEACECPRTKFLKVTALMKLSYAPHLLDVGSTESITMCFREEQQKEYQVRQVKWFDLLEEQLKKQLHDVVKKDKKAVTSVSSAILHLKEELREWILYNSIWPIVEFMSILYYPSAYNFTSAASSPPPRLNTKVANLKHIDVPGSKTAPLYFQIHGPSEISLKVSLSVLHPRILLNAGTSVDEVIDKTYLILERFEWFVDKDLPLPKGYLTTKGYDSVELFFPPGRHYCRLWVHSQMNWHIAMVSDSSVLLGTRDQIQLASTRDCPWTVKFLTGLGTAFVNWIRVSRYSMSTENILQHDKEFYQSYQPDLEWDPKVTGYHRVYVHWMFRKALQSFLTKRLVTQDFYSVCSILRCFFNDPDFGFPPKPKPSRTLRDIADRDPCDCVMPEIEFETVDEESLELIPVDHHEEVSNTIDPMKLCALISAPMPPIQSQLCELATDDVPCGILKFEREKIIRKHEAATLIQAMWRGAFCRKCLNQKISVTPEVLKLLMENVFGNFDGLSGLMNEFFMMYPKTRYAYSISSGLCGVHGVQQYNGTAYITPKCKWVPFFQGNFYCHECVKVHLDLFSNNIEKCHMVVYNNDTGLQKPQTFTANAHLTFDFSPNYTGYTVIGHGILMKPMGFNVECHWTLTVMVSIDNAFHVCDNPDSDVCIQRHLGHALKLHVDEIFVPNRRNILGGIQIAVTRVEPIVFRIASTNPDLEMEAVLRSTGPDGEPVELGKCHGKGEIFWPYIWLKPSDLDVSKIAIKTKAQSTHSLVNFVSNHSMQKMPAPGHMSARSLKGKARSKERAVKSYNKFTPKIPQMEAKIYTIEVTATKGWPLSVAQWKRVDEWRNDIDIPKESAQKKLTKEKGGSAKGKKEDDKKDDGKQSMYQLFQPLEDDAYVELECATNAGGGATAKRDDERDILFALERKSWDPKNTGRNEKGAKIRKEFREEFLFSSLATIQKSETPEDKLSIEELELLSEISQQQKLRTTPVTTESGLLEITEALEEEEESLFLTMPEVLRDKFLPLFYVPLCTKENEEQKAILTEEMAEAAITERNSRIEAESTRMNELQSYNDNFVLNKQKRRCKLLDKYGVDEIWNPDLATAYADRNEVISQLIIDQTVSVNKKKKDDTAAAKENHKKNKT